MNDSGNTHSLLRDYRFWAIIILGTTLRFWEFWNLPFTHDEFSALFRLSFDSFGEFIEKGVKHDTHPAFTQVFLWIWTNAFGTAEWVVKMPFLILGTISIVLIAFIGKQWFSSETGLYSAAVFSVLQTSIFHSQTARPYTIGLFFLLLAVWSWNKYLNNNKYKYLIIISLSLFTCATTHYFSLLAAALFFILAAFNTPKEKLIAFCSSGLMSAILFLPHLSITLHQLSKGGIGTVLAAPDQYFLSNYFSLTFHHSVWFICGILLVILINWTLFYGRFRTIRKYFILSLGLFLMPIVIGMVYSHLRNPVLMERSLYFTLPFILLAVFSISETLKIRWANTGLLLILISSGLYSLVEERKHYKITYESGYDHVLLNAYQYLQKDAEHTAVLISGVPKILNYTCLRNKIPTDFFSLVSDNNEVGELKKTIENGGFKNICIGRTMQYYVPDLLFDKTLLDSGYKLNRQYNYFNSDLRIYSKATDTSLLVDVSIWPENIKGWEFLTERIDSTGNLMFLPEQEFGLAFAEDLSPEFYIHPNREIIVGASSSDEFPEGTELVVYISRGHEEIYYNSAKTVKGDKEISLGVRLCDIDPWFEEMQLRTYLWNKNKSKFKVSKMYRIILPGNPIQYSLTEPIYHE